MKIRAFHDADMPHLIDLTIETFRPLFSEHLPDLMSPGVFAHDHGNWRDDYRDEVPGFNNPAQSRFITVAEEGSTILGYVGWNISKGDSGRLEMVAVHPDQQGKGVGGALCRSVLAGMKNHGVVAVHIGTGGDEFHAAARRLYESLGFTGYPVVDYTKTL